MGGSSTGSNFVVVTFGESHGPAVGAVIDGVVPGIPLTTEMVAAELDRRRPGRGELVSPRREPDVPEILSGVFDGVTTGHPICILIRNHDANPAEYQAFAKVFRPGHGDQSWLARYGIRDWRGGGRQSGRETAGRVAAGVVAKAVLAPHGVRIRAHVVGIAGITAPGWEDGPVDWDAAAGSPVRCADAEASRAMEVAVRTAIDQGDSVGGIVEIVATGVPAGLGDPVFDKLDARLAAGLMSIGAVKGVEIGEGFKATLLRGSQMNDRMDVGGYVTNHAGGILGGISNGMPIVCRIAVKPTPGIAEPMDTVNENGEAVEYRRDGRSDPCICIRIVPVAEAMVAIALADSLSSLWSLQDSMQAARS